MALIKRNTAYILNDIVNTKYGTKLKCTTAGTTSTDPLILDGTSPITDGTVVWEVQEEGTGQGLADYEANKSYNVGDIVIYENIIYKCAIAHTSTAAFDESKWICISGGEISNGMEIVPLWSGNYSTSNESYTLTNTQEISDSYSNYDYLEFEVSIGTTDGHTFITTNKIDTSELSTGYSVISVFVPSATAAYIVIGFTDATHFGIAYKLMQGAYNAVAITSVQGIRKAPTIVSSGMKYETLWEGEAGNYSGESTITINLSEPINKYKKIGFCCIAKNPANNSKKYYYREITVSEFLTFLTNAESNDSFVFCWGYGSKGDAIEIKGSSSNSQLVIQFDTAKITKIIGISEGVTIPTGLQAAKVTLWEGSYNTANNSLTSYSNTIALADSIENYDLLEITFNLMSTQTENNFNTSIFNVSDIKYNKASIRLTAGFGSSFGSFLCSCSDSTHFAICYNNSMGEYTNAVLTKIIGIKYIQPDSYSTEEKLIGTWIDGKPLYRRVFTGTAPSSANVNTNIFTDPLFTNVDMCYVKDGYIKRDAGSGDIDFYTINESNDSAYSSRIFISCSESSIRGAVGQKFTSRPLVVIVEYTKTTD